MNILGLHFGHDAAVAIIKSGEIICNISREREGRIKHALGCTEHDLNLALAEAGLTFQDIDAVTITSTQGVELCIGMIPGFEIELKEHPKSYVQSPFHEFVKKNQINISSNLGYGLKQIFSSSDENNWVAQALKEQCSDEQYNAIKNGTLKTFGWMDHYLEPSTWKNPFSFDEMVVTNLHQAGAFTSPDLKYGKFFPVSINYLGRSLPGYFIDHHAAHAASSYYRSGFGESMIFTLDGHNYHSGYFGYGKDNELFILHPHRLEAGKLYDSVAMLLGLGINGGAGKLMGLAPYGKPRFYDPVFCGNNHELIERLQTNNPTELWQHYCLLRAKDMGYDISLLAKKESITADVNIDIAASTQKLLEETVLRAVNYGYSMMARNNLSAKNLCLSGGVALNCPANQRIYNECAFDEIYIEPSCTDEGLSIGSALYFYHHICGNKLKKPKEKYSSPYLGATISTSHIDKALKKYAGKISITKLDQPYKNAAEDLSNNKVIAWYEGRSENGPRALCHRSILANPTYHENWRRVNNIKGREEWRPFAPVILEEETDNWFGRVPKISPYMLFTADVKTNNIPAITHVDRTARIQTVNNSSGSIYLLLKEFFAKTKVPILMNTSFNGPKEPIIEKPEEALEFLVNSKIDALYMEGYKIERK